MFKKNYFLLTFYSTYITYLVIYYKKKYLLTQMKPTKFLTQKIFSILYYGCIKSYTQYTYKKKGQILHGYKDFVQDNYVSLKFNFDPSY